nr:MAG TPA: hypothetical protein [Caudoviricetes sp.]
MGTWIWGVLEDLRVGLMGWRRKTGELGDDIY